MKCLPVALVLVTIPFAAVAEPTVESEPKAIAEPKTDAVPKTPLAKSGRAHPAVCELAETGEPLWKIGGGDDAPDTTSVFALGFSRSGRLAWLEQRTATADGAAEWIVHVTALANGRSVAAQTYRASKGGLAALCARHAREVASLLAANGVTTTGAITLNQPAVDSDPTGVELRAAKLDGASEGGTFDLVLRGSAGTKVIGILSRAEGAAPPAVLGFIRSPFERRVAVPVKEQAAGPGGRIETRVQFYGGRLDRGWTPEADASRP
jgi:hypothetical protein